MAYPLAPMPTLGEFVARATGEFGATLNELENRLAGYRGPVPLRYLWRGTSFAVLPDVADHDPLTPDVLRSLCEPLAIPPTAFGLSLTE